MTAPMIVAQIELARFRFEEHNLRSIIATTVGADLARKANNVEAQAKQNASGRPGPNVITGRLRGSITWRLGVDELGLYADVGTAVEYAPYVERLYPFLEPALPAARL